MFYRLSIPLLFASLLAAQDAPPGRAVFENRCSRCHGADANGGEMGPPIRSRIAERTDRQLAMLIKEGLPGMPAVPVTEQELAPLTAFLRSLQTAREPL